MNVVRCGSKCLDARNSYIIPALFLHQKPT
nr:MAG TPA: hypothetical protein [Caudoviricetes sp.]